MRLGPPRAFRSEIATPDDIKGIFSFHEGVKRGKELVVAVCVRIEVCREEEISYQIDRRSFDLPAIEKESPLEEIARNLYLAACPRMHCRGGNPCYHNLTFEYQLIARSRRMHRAPRVIKQ